MVTKIPFGAPGVASFETGDTYSQVELLAGDTPALGNSADYIVADDLALPIYSVVGLNADNELVLSVRGSVDPDDDIAIIGVTAVAISSTAANRSVRINRSGNFNIKALNWATSYTTDAQKLAAAPPTSTLAFGKNPYDPTFS